MSEVNMPVSHNLYILSLRNSTVSKLSN